MTDRRGGHRHHIQETRGIGLGISGAILAGGLNTRFGGRDKLLLTVKGKCILDRLLDAFDGQVEDILLITNRPMTFFSWNLRIASDVYAKRSSLTGIHTALFYAMTSHVLVTACDLPFLKPAVVRALVDRVAASTDVLVPETPSGIQPLCAVYSKRCLAPIEDQIKTNDFRIRLFYPKVRLSRLSSEEIQGIDPQLSSFLNINSPEDLIDAERRMTADADIPSQT
ncbi:MAG: molybdenum cofactor guanylyltransferase [Desulfobacterales bacterium]